MKANTIAAQTQQLKCIWQDIVRFSPHLRGMLPGDLAKAQQLLESKSGSFSKQFGDHQLLAFYRIAIILSDCTEPLTMSEFGDALAVPLSSATRMVDWLVQSGYAERQRDSQDRRVVRVALTETGRKLYEALDEFINQYVRELLSRFTAQQRVMLITLTAKAVESLKELSSLPPLSG